MSGIDPWYVVVERSALPGESTAWEDVVIGPFKDRDSAILHMEDSDDVDDWCYGEAKSKGYNVDGCYITQEPTIPSYGVNAPLPMLEED